MLEKTITIGASNGRRLRIGKFIQLKNLKQKSINDCENEIKKISGKPENALICLNGNSIFPGRLSCEAGIFHVHSRKVVDRRGKLIVEKEANKKKVKKLASKYTTIFKLLKELKVKIIILPFYYRNIQKICCCKEAISYSIKRQRARRIEFENQIKKILKRNEIKSHFIRFQKLQKTLIEACKQKTKVISHILEKDGVHYSASSITALRELITRALAK